eukprot:1381-Heterococcus_DN1.PRE.1
MNGEPGEFTPFCARCSLSVLQNGSAAESYLLTCQHFICGPCARESASGECPTCKDPSVQAVALSEAPGDVGM